jgi:hypothetical protein
VAKANISTGSSQCNAAYHEKLSMRQAPAVSDYLISKGVAAGSIENYGGGDSQPLTTLAECRVQLELQGTKGATRDHRNWLQAASSPVVFMPTLSTRVRARLQASRKIGIKLRGSFMDWLTVLNFRPAGDWMKSMAC